MTSLHGRDRCALNGQWRGRSPRGFTLVEVLVVMGVVGLLVGVMLPALVAARDAGRGVKCLSNQRQLGLALAMYAEQFDEWHPREARINSDVSWPRALRPLLDGRASWERDLRDQFEHAEYFRDPARAEDGHNIHYVSNGLRFSAPGVFAGPKPITRMSAYPHPALTLYLTCYGEDPEGHYQRQVYGPTGATSDVWVAMWYDLWELGHIDGPAPELRLAPRRHGGGANGLFLDGHAEHVKGALLGELGTWDDRDYRVR